MVPGGKAFTNILVKDGYNVSIVQEPETSFKEDVGASHAVYVSHPKEVAALIEEAVSHPQ